MDYVILEEAQQRQRGIALLEFYRLQCGEPDFGIGVFLRVWEPFDKFFPPTLKHFSFERPRRTRVSHRVVQPHSIMSLLRGATEIDVRVGPTSRRWKC